MRCPICEGEAVFETYIEHWLDDSYPCPYCNGKGEVKLTKWVRYHFWQKAPNWLWEIFTKSEGE